MNSFLLRRLAPFYAINLIIEFLTLGILLLAMREYVDWSFMPMIKTVGVLLKTTTISFLFIMLPYVAYLLFLPAAKINSRFDKIITIGGFAIFVFGCMFEETMSLVFWNKFSAAFNILAVEYLIDMREVAGDLAQNYLFAGYVVSLILISYLVVRRSRQYLFTDLPSPHWFKRLIYTLIYLSFCGLIYVNANERELEIDENYFNNELAKDGVYSLARSLWKSGISYEDIKILKKD